MREGKVLMERFFFSSPTTELFFRCSLLPSRACQIEFALLIENTTGHLMLSLRPEEESRYSVCAGERKRVQAIGRRRCRRC